MGFITAPLGNLTVTESVALPLDLGRSIMPEIQPMGNDALIRVVVLVLGRSRSLWLLGIIVDGSHCVAARLEISAGFMGGAHAGFPQPPEE